VLNVNLLVGAGATGTLSNTTGAVSANESGPGAPSNTATLEVVQAPTVSKAFGAASIPLNGTTSLTFTFSNPNTITPLVGTTLNDNLPSGLVVANPPNVGGTCSADVVASSGSGSIAIANLNLNASASCTVAVDVTGTTGGTKNNTTGQVSSTFDDGTATFRPVTGGTASASVVVIAPPSIAKAFNPALVIVNGTSALTLTITNPAVNTVAQTGVAFTDTLPANLLVSTPNGLSNTCGGTVTATAGSGSISLSGGTVAVASNCTVTVNVTPSAAATYTNTTGAVSSTNGGTGNTATATLNAQTAHFGITKTHSGNFSRGQTGATYTITVSNVGQVPTLGTVTVVDTLPAVPNTLVPTNLAGTGWTCTLGTLTCTRSDVLNPGASYPPITLTVNVPINIQANVTNKATVTGGGDVSADSATDPTHIGPPIQVTFNNSSASVPRGQSVNYGFTLDSSPGLGNVTFSCSGLPAGTLCGFNPGSSSNLTDSINLNIATSGGSASSAAPMFRVGPTYALLFPALGVLGLVLVGKRSKKSKRTRLRWAMALSGLILLLALAGCGGRPNFAGTPVGTYTVTVTATSSTASGSATVTLNVQ
jgi:uncharacterized repeat protein (TIGR01451 family)